VTVITPEGRFSGSAGVIHYRAPSQEVVLENLHSGISSGEQRLFSNANGPGHLVKLNFVTRTVSFDGPVEDLSHRPRRPSVIDGLLKSPGGAEPRH
jgi:hypothetical protein